MLACLGPVVFNLVNDLQSIEEETNSSFAQHEVMGAPIVYEDTGEGEGTITLTGILHPYFFGGLKALAALEAARSAKIPLPLMRGDFAPIGWVLIKTISRKDGELDAREGIGHEIEYTLSLLKVGTPAVSGAASILRIFM